MKTSTPSDPFIWVCAECKNTITDPQLANIEWRDADNVRWAMSEVRVVHKECSYANPAWRNECSNDLGIFDGPEGVNRAAVFVKATQDGGAAAPLHLLAGAFGRQDATEWVWQPSGGGYLVHPDMLRHVEDA